MSLFGNLKEQYKLQTSYVFRRKKSRLSARFKRSSQNNVYKSFVHEKECIFVHIPKSAGKSIALAVYGSDKPGHYFLEDYRYFDGDSFKRYFKFAFVREPVSRFISAYNFLSKGEALPEIFYSRNESSISIEGLMILCRGGLVKNRMCL